MQFRATEGTASTEKPVLSRKIFLTKSRQKVHAGNTQNIVKFFPKQESRHTKMGDSATIHVSFAKHTCPFCKLHTCKWAFSLVEMGIFDVLFRRFYCFLHQEKHNRLTIKRLQSTEKYILFGNRSFGRKRTNSREAKHKPKILHFDS